MVAKIESDVPVPDVIACAPTRKKDADMGVEITRFVESSIFLVIGVCTTSPPDGNSLTLLSWYQTDLSSENSIFSLRPSESPLVNATNN